MLLVLLVSACQFPRPGDRTPDAGPDTPVDAPIDAPADLVTGVISVRYRTAAGTTEVGSDLSTATIAALVPDPGEVTGYRTVVGEGSADGSFRIEGVTPDADYVLKIGTRFYATRAHLVRIYSEVPVRAGAALAVQSTAVSVTLDGLPTRSSVGGAQLVSFAVGVSGDLGFTAPTGTSLGLDWSTDTFATYETIGNPLPEAAAGDDLWFVRWQSTHPRRGASIQSIAGALAIADATIVDGQARLVTGTVALPPTQSYARGLNRVAFDGGYDLGLELGSSALSVRAVPVAATRWASMAPFDVGAIVAAATQSQAEVPLAFNLQGGFPDPFPASWPRVEQTVVERRRWYRLPGRPPTSMQAGTTRLALVAGATMSASPVAPPSAVRVEGRPAEYGGAVRLTGAPIHLTWNGVASARQFHVTVLRVTSAGPRIAAVFTTAGTTAALPSEMFSGGDFYLLAVSSFSGGNDYAAGELSPSGIPSSLATTVSALFRITATCGDGNVDVGEECDAAGAETAGCDLDCTFVLCGDGTRNVAAGEVCDSAVDTVGCNATCTQTVCGDGYRNVDIEDCDDGNVTVEANGCGPQCRFIASCGNGVVEVLAEECDAAGESGTCDADCSAVMCGDYYVNASAGEQCDDGNRMAGDGCSSSCQIE